MADVSFSTLPAATVTAATELATVQSGTWKKFALSDIPVATTSAAGLMSATDKTNLDAAVLETDTISVSQGGTGATTAAGARTALGLGSLATQNGTFSGTSSGTNTGDQTITLTGDVTGTGTGTFASTIANGAITSDKIGSGAVTTGKIGVAAVTSTTIADSNVTSAKIADSNVTTAKINDLAVTTAKIADLSVTGAKMESSGVTAGTYNFATVTVDAKGRVTSASTGTASTIVEYDAGNGARVTATGEGVTFARTSSSLWEFAIPSGVQVLSFSVYSTTTPATLDLGFNYASNSTFNQGASTARPPRGIHVFTWTGGTPPYIPATTANANAGINAKVSLLAVGSGNISIRFTSFSTTIGSGNPNTIFGGF